MGNIIELESTKRPELFQSLEGQNGISNTIINFDVKESIENNETKYKYFSIEVAPAQISTYKDLVTTIITSRYSFNDIQAIVINSLDGDESHLAELKELQEWRVISKKTAKEIFSKKNRFVEESNSEESDYQNDKE